MTHDLETALLDAHASGDNAALVQLYTQAANQAAQEGQTDASCFFLTHAFIFALESGAPEAAALNARLAHLGRAHLLSF
ncbi:hypothetical protein [Yoonia sediminilitoris]|uniref:Tetratricopeptide repeat protein n=1 Tax=Yoonia sediminilitoris TaxID=1286148 RepID=A0A2T6KI61_9RHOB|nr:hypothetical protein [Yoonia sediminilitoris]PUB15420.1 hypothetical protein C8N45_10440 [Yoonia sediminilitoris]RCW96030.1 hypothetical protein DFP92_10440 [Yoonia sediminilitoris]